MTSGAKMRVYEIAKELKVPNKELIAKIRALGLEVNNHMSSLDAEDVTRLKRSIERERIEQTETKRLSSSVLRRRSKGENEEPRRRVVGAADEPERHSVKTSPSARPAPAVNNRSVEQPRQAPGPVQPRPQVRERAPEARPQPTAASQPAPVQAPVAAPPAEISRPAPAAPAVAPPTAAPAGAGPATARASEGLVQPPQPRSETAPPQETRVEAVKETVKEAAKSGTKEAIQDTTKDAPVGSRREAPAEVRAETAKTADIPANRPGASAPAPATAAPTGSKPGSQPRAAHTDKQTEKPALQAQSSAPKSAPKQPTPVAAQARSEAQSKVSDQPQPEPVAQSAQPAAERQTPQESRKPKTPAVIAGPSTVTIGQGPAPAKAQREEVRSAPAQRPPQAQSQPTSAQPQQAQAQPDKRRPPQPRYEGPVKRAGKKAGPTTVQEVAQAARSRFEEELARARERVSAREAEEQRRKVDEVTKVETQQRDPNRPAVGSVIALPIPRIKILERAPTQPRPLPGQGQIRGRFATQQQRGRPSGGAGANARNKSRDFGKKRPPLKKGRSTQITTPAEHKRILRMEDMISIPDIAKAMGVKANEVLKKLWGMGMVGLNINASIDFETAQILVSEFGYEVHNVSFKEAEAFVSEPDEEKDLAPRAPVVTVMGHVDHGKTSLLDYIRKSRVAAGESGGITQHIAAYKVPSEHGDTVFLDTPGHEAFTEMRARGAQATDIVILVVAANDGVMPQTVEALSHAKDAKVAIIVAVNKCDLPDAQPERVRQQLAEHGLIPEEWGGDTQYINVSAIKGEGIPELLGAVGLVAELLELKANPFKPALGVVIEAKLDRNRGPMATVLIQEGQLKVGDTVVAGCYYGKVRAMLDDLGRPLKLASPSTPIELLGLDGVPDAGETLNVADDEKVAKQVVEHRRQAKRKRELAASGRVSLETLMERIQEGETHELKVVLKTDVQGSSEALKASLIKLSTEKVRVHVIQAGVGGITESDVNLAKAGGAIIVGFHVRPAGKSAKHAEKEGVQIKLYDVIYEALEDVRLAMAGLLAPIKREHEIGKCEVRETFTIPKMGTVAGCMVTEGRVMRKSFLRVVRDAVQVYEGKVGSLRRFKEDTSEVKEGYECGLMVQGFNDIRVGDIIEAYEIVEEAAKL